MIFITTAKIWHRAEAALLREMPLIDSLERQKYLGQIAKRHVIDSIKDFQAIQQVEAGLTNSPEATDFPELRNVQVISRQVQLESIPEQRQPVGDVALQLPQAVL